MTRGEDEVSLTRSPLGKPMWSEGGEAGLANDMNLAAFPSLLGDYMCSDSDILRNWQGPSNHRAGSPDCRGWLPSNLSYDVITRCSVRGTRTWAGRVPE